MDYLHRAKLFRTKKRLGQNFLVNPDVIQAILDSANISKEDTVLEIGAGVGFVTEQLVRHAKRVIAIELDESAIRELEKIKCDNLEIVHQDILKTDLSDFTTVSRVGLLSHQQKIKIVANIPYYITSPIITHLLGEIDDLKNKNREHISEIILMVQYEVAQRIVANEKSPSKQYGLLTILSQFWAECEIIQKVGRKSFYPSPKVDSALVKMTVREKPLLELSDYKHFRKTIKAAFSQRRKNIKNCLLSGGFSKENIVKSLKNLGISENTRGETISIEDFGKLSEELIKNA
ncbi:MAG: 16S rRNA (adenine(1518)-N(6)/adenine(1519)-N(6))-dimethyltransferase RsmA [Candidatus Gastranaerophilales bacterium]|nr:16S rRNA (adenine(1518)-N(6)/adenine(1519)-N(6))-dimethyltransferase RsmA [Candidatus Gastranaerophilales bacterium]